MTTEPSPRPWRVSDGFLDRYSTGHRDIVDANGEFVAVRVSSADAALIVDAVNERDRLRAELADKTRNYEDVIAFHTRTEESLRDLVRRLAEQLADAVRLTPYDAIARDLLREARAALGEEKE